MLPRYICWFAAFAAIVGSSALAEPRKWNDSSGKSTIDAELIAVKDGKVLLRRSDGKEGWLPLERLSVADRAFVVRQTPPPAPRAAAAPLAACSIAIVGRGEDAALGIAALVETQLSPMPGVALVERAEIDKVIREQELQAAFAPEGVGKRCALGRLLKADLLVFLDFQAKPVPHLSVVVGETRQGLRLCTRPLVLSRNVEADARSIVDSIDAARRLETDKAVEIAAVPPLMNNSLTHEADQLQGVFARLIERDLLQRRGVVAVELAEAQAVAREMAIGGQAKLQRRLPLYVMGEYRVEGPRQNPRCRFSLKLLRGSTELDRCGREDLPLEGVAAELLFESSLLLLPDQPSTHHGAMLAYHRLVRRELDKGRLGFSLRYGDDCLRACAYQREVVRHMERFLIGTKVARDKGLGVMGFDLDGSGMEGVGFLWSAPLGDPAIRNRLLADLGPEAFKKYDDPRIAESLIEVNEELVAAARRVFAAKAAAGALDDTLALLGVAALRAHGFPFVQFKGGSDPAAVLERSRDRREYALILLKQYAGSNDERALDGLLRAVEKGLPAAEYLEFLQAAGEIPSPRIKRMANTIIGSVKRRLDHKPPTPEQLQAQRDAARRAAEPKKPEDVPETEADVVFRPIALEQGLPSGLAELMNRRGEKERIGAWVRHLCATSKGTDFLAIEGWMFFMREKGRLQQIPGVWLASDPDMENRAPVCWDGKYLWAVCSRGANRDNLSESLLWLAAIDPVTGRVFGIGSQEGLPPMKDYFLTAIQPGKIFVAGATERTWLALASIEAGGRPKFDLLHEARETMAKESGGARDAAPDHLGLNVAFKPRYCCALTAPGADGKTPEQRVLVGRYVRGTGNVYSTALVDPHRRTVEILPREVLPSYHSGMSYEGWRYWQQPRYKDRKANSGYPLLGTLCRTGFPDFKTEVLEDVVVPHGLMLMHEGRFYVLGTFTQQLHVADGITGQLRPLRGRCPNGANSLFVSNLYGIVVRTGQGLYHVDLKSP